VPKILLIKIVPNPLLVNKRREGVRVSNNFSWQAQRERERERTSTLEKLHQSRHFKLNRVVHPGLK
jgi:hypothetical protein